MNGKQSSSQCTATIMLHSQTNQSNDDETAAAQFCARTWYALGPNNTDTAKTLPPIKVNALAPIPTTVLLLPDRKTWRARLTSPSSVVL